MLIETRAVAPFYKNGFVVACNDTREAVLIDPGDEIAELLRIADEQRMKVRYILLTHAHMDHVSGVAAAKRATGAPIGVHREDLFLYDSAVKQGELSGTRSSSRRLRLLLRGGDAADFGRCEVRVHHTPGHSPGGVLPPPDERRDDRDPPVRRRHAVRAVESAGPTCPAATTRRSWHRFEACCSASGMPPSSTRAWPGHDHRP